MAKYHVNPQGNPGVCRATQSCPFGGEDQHYSSKEEARKAYEETMTSPEPQSILDREVKELEIFTSPEESISLGTQDSCVLTANKLYMTVRGGGLGGKAWVAAVEGPDPKYRFARSFVDQKSNLSRSGASGTITWPLPGDGLYEYRDVCISSRYTESGFFLVRDGMVQKVTQKQALNLVKD